MDELGFRKEPMLPAYENIYVKQFVLFDDEAVHYYFQETLGKEDVSSEKKLLENQSKIFAGKHGRINAMLDMAPASCKKAMMDYRKEERLAERLFKMY